MLNVKADHSAIPWHNSLIGKAWLRRRSCLYYHFWSIQSQDRTILGYISPSYLGHGVCHDRLYLIVKCWIQANGIELRPKGTGSKGYAASSRFHGTNYQMAWRDGLYCVSCQITVADQAEEIIGDTLGLELVGTERTFMGYIHSIGSWMNKDMLLLCELFGSHFCSS
jgi:hypothetical protein